MYYEYQRNNQRNAEMSKSVQSYVEEVRHVGEATGNEDRPVCESTSSVNIQTYSWRFSCPRAPKKEKLASCSVCDGKCLLVESGKCVPLRIVGPTLFRPQLGPCQRNLNVGQVFDSHEPAICQWPAGCQA